MQDGWGGGGDELGLSAGQWEPDDGDMWNSPASQESNSSCSSWGNPPKKGPPKVRGLLSGVSVCLCACVSTCVSVSVSVSVCVHLCGCGYAYVCIYVCMLVWFWLFVC